MYREVFYTHAVVRMQAGHPCLTLQPHNRVGIKHIPILLRLAHKVVSLARRMSPEE